MKNSLPNLLLKDMMSFVFFFIVFSLPYSGHAQSDIRNITAIEVTQEMEIGWNLGNSFDVISRDKTFWGNPLPSKKIIDDVNKQGFKTLRIPITWEFHMSEAPDYTIEEEYLDRVEEVVNYGLDNDMYVIINTHHDEWIIPSYAEESAVSDRLAKLWTQVASRFKDYNDFLIFETLNEPRLRGTPVEWTGSTEGWDVVNRLNQVSVDAIRNTGGNNAQRFLMIPTYAANTNPGSFDELVIPNNDPKIIVSIHTYFPFQFTLDEQGTDSWGTTQELADLDQELERVKAFFADKGQAVVLGEWGTIDKNNLSERVEYTIEYAQRASDKGLTTIVWDDGGNLQLYDRHGLVWTSNGQQIVDAIIETVGEVDDTDVVTSTESDLGQNESVDLQVYKSNSNWTLKYNSTDRDIVSLNIIDTLGKPIKSLPISNLRNSKANIVLWDGRSDAGTQLPTGVYIAILKGSSWVESKRFVLNE